MDTGLLKNPGELQKLGNMQASDTQTTGHTWAADNQVLYDSIQNISWGVLLP